MLCIVLLFMVNCLLFSAFVGCLRRTRPPFRCRAAITSAIAFDLFGVCEYPDEFPSHIKENGSNDNASYDFLPHDDSLLIK